MTNERMPRGGRTVRGIRLTDDEWAALRRLAEALGCLDKNGQPSVGVLMVELARGSVVAVRTRHVLRDTKAARIRALIAENPAASNAEIAAMCGEPRNYVAVVRIRARADAAEVKD